MFGVCVSIANKQDVSVYFSYLPLLLLLLPDMYLFLSVMMMTFYGKNGFANSICFIQNTNKHTYISYFEQKIHIWNTANLMMMEQQLRHWLKVGKKTNKQTNHNGKMLEEYTLCVFWFKFRVFLLCLSFHLPTTTRMFQD